MRHTRAGVLTIRVCGIAALVVGLVASSGAQVPSRPFGLPNVPRESAPTAGMLLVASRELRDPHFVETVILLTGYGAEGAVGLVLNRRTTVPLARVFPSLPSTASSPDLVFQGGPVEVTTAQALRRGRADSRPGLRVSDDLHVIGTPDALEAQLAESTSSSVVRVFLGYAGWSAGQLDAEVAAGAWHVFPPDTTVVFDDTPDTLWTRQIRRTEWRSAGLRATGYGLQASGYGLRATGYRLQAERGRHRPAVSRPAATRLVERLGDSGDGVVALYLFGSHAEGRAHTESDLDIGVLLDRRHAPTSRERFELRLRLLGALSRPEGQSPMS